jgi:hypothetical protein
MIDKLDAELRQRIHHPSDPGALIPVIVTLREGARAAEVIPGRIDHEFPVISAASCRLTAQQILGLSNHPSVRQVEYDGEARALER